MFWQAYIPVKPWLLSKPNTDVTLNITCASEPWILPSSYQDDSMVSVIQISFRFLKCLGGTVPISCLVYCMLTPHSDNRSVHPRFCVSEMHSLALLSNGPLYGYSTFYLLFSIYTCTVSCTSLHSVSFHFFLINK